MNEEYIFPGFDECIKLIRSEDPLTYEDGYHMLLDEVKKYGDKLVKLIEKEEDPKIRSRFIELLGECKDPKYIPIFKSLLSSNFHDIVAWSLTSLDKIPEGKDIAEKFRDKNPYWKF